MQHHSFQKRNNIGKQNGTSLNLNFLPENSPSQINIGLGPTVNFANNQFSMQKKHAKGNCNHNSPKQFISESFDPPTIWKKSPKMAESQFSSSSNQQILNSTLKSEAETACPCAQCSKQDEAYNIPEDLEWSKSKAGEDPSFKNVNKSSANYTSSAPNATFRPQQYSPKKLPESPIAIIAGNTSKNNDLRNTSENKNWRKPVLEDPSLKKTDKSSANYPSSAPNATFRPQQNSPKRLPESPFVMTTRNVSKNNDTYAENKNWRETGVSKNRQFDFGSCSETVPNEDLLFDSFQQKLDKQDKIEIKSLMTCLQEYQTKRRNIVSSRKLF